MSTGLKVFVVVRLMIFLSLRWCVVRRLGQEDFDDCPVNPGFKSGSVFGRVGGYGGHLASGSGVNVVSCGDRHGANSVGGPARIGKLHPERISLIGGLERSTDNHLIVGHGSQLDLGKINGNHAVLVNGYGGRKGTAERFYDSGHNVFLVLWLMVVSKVRPKVRAFLG